jgi:hypothetical protein
VRAAGTREKRGSRSSSETVMTICNRRECAAMRVLAVLAISTNMPGFRRIIFYVPGTHSVLQKIVMMMIFGAKRYLYQKNSGPRLHTY